MGKFIIKHIKTMKPQKKVNQIINAKNEPKNNNIVEEVKMENKIKDNQIINAKNEPKNNNIVKEVKMENKIIENKEVMTTSEKIAMAQSVLTNEEKTTTPFKRVKKDKGLIERTESSKTILTEDNKELLKD